MRAFLSVVGLLTVFLSSTLVNAQTSGRKFDFVVDPNRPYVYLLFDHVGEGPRLFDDEPSTRIWFRLINNCRVPITVRTYGAPEGSAKKEVGVMHDVVANVEPSVKRIVVIPHPENGLHNGAEPSSGARDKAELTPRGYNFHALLTVLRPQQSLLFSIPTTHLSKKWHIEIPYEFLVSTGNEKPEGVGGYPYMHLSYADWHLPEKVRRELEGE